VRTFHAAAQRLRFRRAVFFSIVFFVDGPSGPRLFSAPPGFFLRSSVGTDFPVRKEDAANDRSRDTSRPPDTLRLDLQRSPDFPSASTTIFFPA
jgi:hypothetical protein